MMMVRGAETFNIGQSDEIHEIFRHKREECHMMVRGGGVADMI